MAHFRGAGRAFDQGLLSMGDFAKSMGSSIAERMVATLDTNGDGKVDYRDFVGMAGAPAAPRPAPAKTDVVKAPEASATTVLTTVEA